MTPHRRTRLEWARRITQSPPFNHAITGVILLNAVVIGLDTDAALAQRWGHLFTLANQIFLGVYIVEALLKMAAEYPSLHRYFRDGWNLFDFGIIVVSLIPATGQLAMLARLARLLRVLRLISTLPELRLIVATLVRSIPSMGHVLALMSIIFYVYAVAGYHLFHAVDPTHWRTLGIALLSLFRIVTLEDWTDIMYAAMAVKPWAWVYFVSFVVLGTFVVVNLFIAVVINNLEEAKAERVAAEAPAPANPAQLQATLEQELQAARAALERIETHLRHPPEAP